jgi:hypothetical protein
VVCSLREKRRKKEKPGERRQQLRVPVAQLHSGPPLSRRIVALLPEPFGEAMTGGEQEQEAHFGTEGADRITSPGVEGVAGATAPLDAADSSG